jgi:SAM-dependent methyltransferase
MADNRPAKPPSDRDLPQHQAALTLIRDRLDDAAVSSFAWLDLGCGRGKILQAVERVLPEDSRAKMNYVGIDVQYDSLLATERQAKILFPSANVIVSELFSFEKQLEAEQLFDAVTITNTVHEVSPRALANLLLGAVCRTSSRGFIFIYDMERLPELELGAVPWKPGEIERIARCLTEACGSTIHPAVATWQHRTTTGWQLQLKRSSLPISQEELAARRSEIHDRVASTVADVLQLKLNETSAALNALSRYGMSTDEEHFEANRLAYDFWAIARCLRSIAGESYDGIVAL